MTVVAPEPSPAAGPQAISGRRLWLIIAALLTGMLLAALDQTIVSTALPTILRARRESCPPAGYLPAAAAPGYSADFASC